MRIPLVLVCLLLSSCNYYHRKTPYEPEPGARDCTLLCGTDGSVLVQCPRHRDEIVEPDEFLTVCIDTGDFHYITQTYEAADFVDNVCGRARYFVGACE